MDYCLFEHEARQGQIQCAKTKGRKNSNAGSIRSYVARVSPEINARDLPLVPFDNRLQYTVPSVGARSMQAMMLKLGGLRDFLQ